jgi:hypothetical protein
VKFRSTTCSKAAIPSKNKLYSVQNAARFSSAFETIRFGAKSAYCFSDRCGEFWRRSADLERAIPNNLCTFVMITR